jgi:DNA-binding winged helix-turn-helix (wHTH) protein/tetratricopeptide (TPR) repeat protein
MTAARIDLGLAPPARLGRLALQPATRTVRRDDGVQETVEPRVMQVLLALADKRGEIVRREELTERCWEGRVVGEDAINRVLSRLRRVAEGIGSDSFRIETVTKIGYRLMELGASASHGLAAPLSGGVLKAAPATRRTALIGAGVAGGLALAGGAWWRFHKPTLPAPARAAMERGLNAYRMQSLGDLTTAAAAFHEATRLAPRAPEPWGFLALAYGNLYAVSRGQEVILNAQRARDAAAKALSLDPNNAEAQATLATLQPEFLNWLAYDKACRPVLAHHPDAICIGMLYIGLLANVGRIREINKRASRLVAQDPGYPTNHTNVVLSSWCLGRLDDADAAMDRAFQLWPSQIGIWFTRQRLLAYSGRAAAAVAMVADVDHRPPGVPDWDFELSAAESRALLTRSKTDIDAAAALYWPRIRSSVGAAGNGAQFFAAVGRLDDAFAVLNALYFNRGFVVGNRRFTEEQGTYSERGNLPTWMFWLPFMTDLRRDRRTAAIMQDVGLSDYWRTSGHHPDFIIAGDANA